jgi:hypothetical protein
LAIVVPDRFLVFGAFARRSAAILPNASVFVQFWRFSNQIAENRRKNDPHPAG